MNSALASIANGWSSFVLSVDAFLSRGGVADRFNYYAIRAMLLLCIVGLASYIAVSCYQRFKTNFINKQDGFQSTHTFTDSGLYVVAVIFVLFLGAFLRFWNLPGLPDGLQQDEASIGYEAYCLLHYGIDRNGYPYPVYPVTWGSGGGSPLMIYLNVLTTALFGSNVWAIRIVPAFFGVLTLALFFLLLKKAFGKRTALAGLVILTLAPWHIILSRWSLDSNTMPFWQILAAFVFIRAAAMAIPDGNRVLLSGNTDVHGGYEGGEEQKRRSYSSTKQTWAYMLAAFLFGICLYSYGSANFIMPVVVLVMALWGLRHHLLSFGQLVLCFLIFLLTVSPLAYFYGVNFLGFPEIVTPWLSFPKFTSSHFGSVFLSVDSSFPEKIRENAIGLLQILTVGKADEVSWNAMPGYWVLYEFTWPVTLIGIVLGGWLDKNKDRRSILRHTKNGNKPVIVDVTEQQLVHVYMRVSLFVALVFALLVQQTINRNVMLFLPLIYWNVMGLRWIWNISLGKFRLGHLLAGLSMLVFLGGACLFIHDYYGGMYNQYCAHDFMPGYGEAMVYADQLAKKAEALSSQVKKNKKETAGQAEEKKDNTGSSDPVENDDRRDSIKVYSTYEDVASPFMITLYYTKYNPYDFLNTVQYRDTEAEFRIAVSFGHFVFGLPVEDETDLSSLEVLTGPEYRNDIFVVRKEEAAIFPDEDYNKTEFHDAFVVVNSR